MADETPANVRKKPNVTMREGALSHTLFFSSKIVQMVLQGQNLDEAFEATMHRDLQSEEKTRAAVKDLCWRTLRAYGKGDAVLKTYLTKPVPPFVRALLLVCLCRLERRVDEAFTIVNQGVIAVKQESPAFAGLVNAVLRGYLREDKPVQMPEWSFPPWWIKKIRQQYPLEWKTVLTNSDQHPPMSVRVNKLKIGLEHMMRTLCDAGIAVHRLDNEALLFEKPLAIARLPGFAEGYLSVQDAGAQWTVHFLAAEPHQRVLDACAAPGGKTAQILENVAVEVTAVERSPVRAARIHDNLKRLGLKADIKVADCRQLDDWWDGRPYDRILADVPCSASGVIRRHPDIKWHRREKDIVSFVHQQAEIIDALWHTLAPGGRMLYVTCSLFQEENRGQIENFLMRHPDATRLTLNGQQDFQLLPNAEHDGFFYSLLQKHHA